MTGEDVDMDATRVALDMLEEQLDGRVYPFALVAMAFANSTGLVELSVTSKVPGFHDHEERPTALVSYATWRVLVDEMVAELLPRWEKWRGRELRRIRHELDGVRRLIQDEARRHSQGLWGR
jgi:endonuclease YncB( thermonuclease family)